MFRVASTNDMRRAIDAGDMEAVWVESDEWTPAVLLARQRLDAADLPRPNGVRGAFALNYSLRENGQVAWMLYFRPLGSRRGHQVGKFLGSYLPDRRTRHACRPIKTNGRDLFFGDGLHRRVRMDAGGLPVPVLVHQSNGGEVELWPDNPACYHVIE